MVYKFEVKNKETTPRHFGVFITDLEQVLLIILVIFFISNKYLPLLGYDKLL